jgi:HPt (histidine-containing phosphotransfer) domain-containing protein
MNFKEANLSYLMDLSGGETSIIKEMVEMFLSQTPEHLEQLSTHIKEQDWEKIRGMAHHIKPTLSYMGAENMRGIMQEIETLANEKRDYETIVNEFEAVYPRFQTLFEELRSYLSEM